MPWYNVNVETRVTGVIEIEAANEDEAREFARGMDVFDWDETNYEDNEVGDIEFLHDDEDE